jgi:hypothetical protein
MDANRKNAAWSWFRRPRGSGGKRKAHGFVLHEAGARAGRPAPAASARARFEHEARMALRDWLMLYPATSRAVRGPPNEDFGLPPGPLSRDASSGCRVRRHGRRPLGRRQSESFPFLVGLLEAGGSYRIRTGRKSSRRPEGDLNRLVSRG